MIIETFRRAGPFPANGVQTVFPFAFVVLDEGDVVVTFTPTNQAGEALLLNTDYTVTLNPEQDTAPGGDITLTTPLDGGEITITSDTPVEQPAVFTNTGNFYPDTLNDSLDRLTIFAQEHAEKLDRAPLLPLADLPEGSVPFSDGNGGWNFTLSLSGDPGTPPAGIPVSSGLGWSYSLAVPSGVLVGTTATQTLTGKTLTTPVLAGALPDNVAGRLGYSSGLVQYGDGSATRTLVDLSQAQSLTNKTLGSGTDITGGTISAGPSVTDIGGVDADSPGFRSTPVLATAGRTLALSDAGKLVSTTGNITIPQNSSVAFPVGTQILVYNNSGATKTVSLSGDTLRLAGTATTGTRTLAVRGFATLTKVASTEWAVSGHVT